MDTIQTLFSTTKRYRKALWKSLKKKCSLSCLHCKTSKYTTDNESDAATVTTVQNVIVHEDLTATHIDGHSQVEHVLANASSNTEEENEYGSNDTEEQRRNDNNEKPSCDPPARSSTEVTVEPGTSVSPSVEIINNESKCPVTREFGDVNNSGAHQRSETQTTIIVNSTVEGEPREKAVYMFLASNKNVILDKTENAWVPKIAMKCADKQVATDAEVVITLETNKSLRSILNKITSENIDVMIKSCMALPINTTERLENAVDLVFEKAIQEQNYMALYAKLCVALKSIEVPYANICQKTSFMALIRRKCQIILRSDKTRQIASAKELAEIESCTDAEKKKELRFEYEENERRLRKRFVGNCCFIGELFNQHVIHPLIMHYCITYLIAQRSEEPIVCLCNLLRTSGEELEKWQIISKVFSKLRTLMSVTSFPPRTRFMIQDTIDLWENKWSPRTLNVETVEPFDRKNATGHSVN